MKLKSIAAICKSNGRITLVNHDTEQWIGNGYCLFPLSALPPMDEESISAVFDLTEKDREKMVFTIRMSSRIGVSLSDTDDSEVSTLLLSTGIAERDRTLRVYQTPNELVCADAELFSPLVNEGQMLDVFVRYTESGIPYLAIKAGLVLRGIIFPALPHEKTRSELVMLSEGLTGDNPHSVESDYGPSLFDAEG